VHAAQRAFPDRQRIIDLHEPGMQSVLRELFLAEEPGKVSTVVSAFLQVNEIRAGKRQWCELHSKTVTIAL
jgi:hypothetical protein